MKILTCAWVLSLAQVEPRCLISHPGSFERIKYSSPFILFFYLCFAPVEGDQFSLHHKQVRVEVFLLASPLKKKRRRRNGEHYLEFYFKVSLHCGRRAYLWSCSRTGQTRSWSLYPERPGRGRTESTRSLPERAWHWCTKNIVCTTSTPTDCSFLNHSCIFCLFAEITFIIFTVWPA